MLLFIYKIGVHWYFRFAIEMADNRDILQKYKALKQMQQHATQLLILVHIIRPSIGRRIKYKPLIVFKFNILYKWLFSRGINFRYIRE